VAQRKSRGKQTKNKKILCLLPSLGNLKKEQILLPFNHHDLVEEYREINEKQKDLGFAK
jgi:hypothetical protein